MSAEDRRRHKAHLDQHIKDAQGEYHYIGDWYVVSGGRRALLPFAAWSALALIVVFAAGCTSFPGLRNTWYVILPFTAAFGLSIMLIWKSGRLLLSGGRIKTFDYEKALDSVPPAAWGLVLAAVVSIAASGFYLLRHGAEDSVGCAAYFAAIAVAGISAYFSLRAFRAQKWEKE